MAPSTAKTVTPDRATPSPSVEANTIAATPSMAALEISRLCWCCKPLSSGPITAKAPTANTKEPVTKPSVTLLPEKRLCSASPSLLTAASMSSSSPIRVPTTMDTMGIRALLLFSRPGTAMPMVIRASTAIRELRRRSGSSFPISMPIRPPATIAPPFIREPSRIMGSALLRSISPVLPCPPSAAPPQRGPTTHWRVRCAVRAAVFPAVVFHRAARD